MLIKNIAIKGVQQLVFQAKTILIDDLPGEFQAQSFFNEFIAAADAIRSADSIQARETLRSAFAEIAEAYFLFLQARRNKILPMKQISRVTDLLTDAGYQADLTMGYWLINQCFIGLTEYFNNNRSKLSSAEYDALLAYCHKIWGFLPQPHWQRDVTGNIFSQLV